jgi:hypothetical protein
MVYKLDYGLADRGIVVRFAVGTRDLSPLRSFQTVSGLTHPPNKRLPVPFSPGVHGQAENL